MSDGHWFTSSKKANIIKTSVVFLERSTHMIEKDRPSLVFIIEQIDRESLDKTMSPLIFFGGTLIK